VTAAAAGRPTSRRPVGLRGVTAITIANSVDNIAAYIPAS
jgi:hypothetical protein